MLWKYVLILGVFGDYIKTGRLEQQFVGKELKAWIFFGHFWT